MSGDLKLSVHRQPLLQAPALSVARFTASKQTQSTSAAQPKFSGLVPAGATDSLIKLFKNISEVYIYGFLALDVVALWLTRIYKGLDRGREDYDPTQDPTNAGLTPVQVLKKSFFKDFQGLNWSNGLEEFGRELLTGPGALIIPSLIFSWAKRKMQSNAMELSHGRLTQFTEIFHKTMPGSQEPTRDATGLKTVLKQVLSGLIQDDELRKTEMAIPGLTDNEGQPVRQKLGSTIDEWADKFATTASRALEVTDKVGRKAIDTELEKLNGQLFTTLKQYNVQFRRDTQRIRLDDFKIPLNETISPKALKDNRLLYHKNLPALLDDLVRYKDVLAHTFQIARENPAPLHAVLEYSRRFVVKNKFVTAIAATLAAGAYLLMLPRLVQRNAHYPGSKGAGHHSEKPAEPATADTKQAVKPSALPVSQEPATSLPAIKPSFSVTPDEILNGLIPPAASRTVPVQPSLQPPLPPLPLPAPLPVARPAIPSLGAPAPFFPQYVPQPAIAPYLPVPPAFIPPAQYRYQPRYQQAGGPF